MAKKVWTIHVTGPITRLRSDGSPVRVPEGVYTMTEVDPASGAIGSSVATRRHSR
jgi:hypothetical protein